MSNPSLKTEEKLFFFKVLSKKPVVVNRKFRRYENHVRFEISHNLNDSIDLFTIESQIDNLFSDLLKDYLAEASQNDIFSAQVESPKSNLTPIFIPHCRVGDFNASEFLNSIYSVTQSNKEYLLDGVFDVMFTLIKAPPEGIVASGRVSKAPQNVILASRLRRSTVRVAQDPDNACGFRAIVVAIYHHDYVRDKSNIDAYFWDRMRNPQCSQQAEDGKALAVECGLPYGIVTNKELQIIQDKKLSPRLLRLTVIDATNCKNRLFVGACDLYIGQIYLEYIFDNESNAGHLNVITSIKSYMRAKNYCETCHVGFSSFGSHRCESTCDACYSSFACRESEGVLHSATFSPTITCNDCNRSFYTEHCFSSHLSNKCCERIKVCKSCETRYTSKNAHSCATFFCTHCSTLCKGGIKHYCCLQPLNMDRLKDEDNRVKQFVFFDVETTQAVCHFSRQYHSPNLVACMTVCDDCFDSHSGTQRECLRCTTTQYFFGRTCIMQFCNQVYKLAKAIEKEKGRIIVVSHYGAGFDMKFILQDLYSRNFREDPKIIARGLKVLKLDIGNIRFIDSIAILSQPLAALPSAFGFDNDEKFVIPHAMNREENYNYVGRYPTLENFDLKYMKPTEIEKVKKWIHKYRDRKDFNFKESLIAYCIQDVALLTKCFMRFRFYFKQITELDCVTRCFTIASIGMESFRATNLSIEDNMAVSPVKGYYTFKKRSLVSNCWLDLVQKTESITLEREVRVANFYVDGLCKNHIYEFFGCFYHGHNCSPKFFNNLKFEKSERRVAFLKKSNYEVTVMWECHFRKLVRNNLKIRDYVNMREKYYRELESYGGVNLRESLFGGRVNNLHFMYECADNEEIIYQDFTSLYPFVLKRYAYPISHPRILHEDFDYSLESYNGFVKCLVLPPQDLYLAVLPSNINGKLVFALCKTCAEQSQHPCTYNEKERSFQSTFTTPELKHAVRRGYKIVKIFEVYDYDLKSNVFSKYINTWQKVKTESSGYPSWVITPADEDKFINNFLQNEGVLLEKNNIKKNPALKAIAKLMLNSYWGKLCQKTNQPTVKLVKDPSEYFKIISDRTKRIHSDVMVSDNAILLSYSNSDESNCAQTNINVAVASFVTSYARLKLLELMERIESIRPMSLLYHDTDSCIYVRRNGDCIIENGDYFGELTNEIEGKRCIAFLSLGPKFYHLILQNNGELSSILKCKGVKLNQGALAELNLASLTKIAEALQKNSNDEISVPQFQIRSDKHHNLFSTYFEKRVRGTSSKRFSIHNDTYPYGYVKGSKGWD